MLYKLCILVACLLPTLALSDCQDLPIFQFFSFSLCVCIRVLLFVFVSFYLSLYVCKCFVMLPLIPCLVKLLRLDSVYVYQFQFSVCICLFYLYLCVFCYFWVFLFVCVWMYCIVSRQPLPCLTSKTRPSSCVSIHIYVLLLVFVCVLYSWMLFVSSHVLFSTYSWIWYTCSLFHIIIMKYHTKKILVGKI